MDPRDEKGTVTPEGEVALSDVPLPGREEALASLSPKGLRTRRRLLDGARAAFEASGSYNDTRISDIVKASGVSHGSFYTYFETKEKLFYELAVEVVQEMYAETAARSRGEDLEQRIGSAIRQFMYAYQARAGIMAIIEQAAALYPEFRGLRRRIRDAFVSRNITNFAEWSESGRIDGSLDTRVAAHALVSMIDNFSYLWFVLGEEFEAGVAEETLTRLWVNALGLVAEPDGS